MTLHLCKTGGSWGPFISYGAPPVRLQCEWGRGNGILRAMHREAAVSLCESQNPVGEIMLIANICVVLSD